MLEEEESHGRSHFLSAGDHLVALREEAPFQARQGAALGLPLKFVWKAAT